LWWSGTASQIDISEYVWILSQRQDVHRSRPSSTQGFTDM
jgi:hypothetical protein